MCKASKLCFNVDGDLVGTVPIAKFNAPRIALNRAVPDPSNLIKAYFEGEGVSQNANPSFSPLREKVIF